jgi:hypothetical protein
MRHSQFVVAFVLLHSMSGQVNADPGPSNLDYYGYFHHYTVFPNYDCFGDTVCGFDVTNHIADYVNYLFINGNLSLSNEIDENYTVENLGKRFVDLLKKQIVVQLPDFMGVFPGTDTPIIMEQYKNENGTLKRFNEFPDDPEIQDFQIQRFILLWTGWEYYDDDHITVLGVTIPKPSLTPASEFIEDDDHYEGLGVAAADFYEHIAFLELGMNPTIRFQHLISLIRYPVIAGIGCITW